MAQTAQPLPASLPVLVTESVNDGVVEPQSIAAMEQQWCAAGSTIDVNWFGPLRGGPLTPNVMSHMYEGSGWRVGDHLVRAAVRRHPATTSCGQMPPLALRDSTPARASSEVRMSTTPHVQVAIVGGGFGGCYVARGLGHHGIDVAIIDSNGFQTFQPMLYQAATGLVALDDIKFPLTELHHVRSIVDEVTAIDLNSRTLTLAGGGELTADYVVIATGTSVNFFSVTGAVEHAYPSTPPPTPPGSVSAATSWCSAPAQQRCSGGRGCHRRGDHRRAGRRRRRPLPAHLPRLPPRAADGAPRRSRPLPLAAMTPESQAYATKGADRCRRELPPRPRGHGSHGNGGRAR